MCVHIINLLVHAYLEYTFTGTSFVLYLWQETQLGKKKAEKWLGRSIKNRAAGAKGRVFF